jgi:hypothetical protein
MTPRQIAALAVRLFSLTVLFSALNLVPVAVLSISALANNSSFHVEVGSMERIQNFGFILQCVVTFGVALLLWMFADRLATLMVKEPVETNIEKSNGGQLQNVAFATIGLFTAVQAFEKIVSSIVSIRAYKEYPAMADMGIRARTSLATELVMLFIGLGLIFGAYSLSKFIHSIRGAGRDPEFSEESPAE